MICWIDWRLLCWMQANAAESTWLTDVPKAQAQAKAENKMVLLDFTGSDWCRLVHQVRQGSA